jgi:uncharacterized protein YdbL (DUF1318 family)
MRGSTKRLGIIGVALFAGALAAGAAHAQIGDAVVDAAIAANQVGEQADGYLGLIGSVAPNVKGRVDQINIRRRAAYTERASQRSVTVDEMARATGCTLIVKNTPSGASWRDDNGSWRKNTGGVTKPSYCPS